MKKAKRYPWEPKQKYYWDASLTGDLVCGNCSKTMVIAQGKKPSPGLIPCSSCKEEVELLPMAIEVADRRASAAFPKGRPPQEGFRWKGD